MLHWAVQLGLAAAMPLAGLAGAIAQWPEPAVLPADAALLTVVDGLAKARLVIFGRLMLAYRLRFEQ
ncbi:hypothetical protein [Sphingomonas montana]|uniref:hypothetical protein n=1 Tax=Sphingomonas montana TaxID=1843236 RepID=UPI00096C18BB|nr:hypothetical protein [Sphingomonas montana]